MTATILVVDDEPDLEALVLQKFRKQIRDGTMQFVFAHDGIEALESIVQNPDVVMVVSDINMPGWTGCRCSRGCRRPRKEVDRHRLGLWRHEQHPHRDEPRRVRFSHQADRFGDLEMTIDKTVRHVEAMREARRRQLEASARMRRCRGISRRRSPPAWPPTATAWRCTGAR